MGKGEKEARRREGMGRGQVFTLDGEGEGKRIGAEKGRGKREGEYERKG